MRRRASEYSGWCKGRCLILHESPFQAACEMRSTVSTVLSLSRSKSAWLCTLCVKVGTSILPTTWEPTGSIRARRQDVEIEMEVKSPSADAGRKIHRKEMNRLADLMVPTTKQLANEQGCHLLRITVPDRLPAGEKELVEISALVAKAAAGKSTVSADLGRVEYGARKFQIGPTHAAAMKPESSSKSYSGLAINTFYFTVGSVILSLLSWSKVHYLTKSLRHWPTKPRKPQTNARANVRL